MRHKSDVTPSPDSLPSQNSHAPGSGPFFDYIRYSEFKRLLGGLIAIVDRDQLKVVTVLSEFPQEGKTFFVAATALGYAALLGKRVLVVNTSLVTKEGSLSLKRIYHEQFQNVPLLDGRTSAARMIDFISPLANDGPEPAITDFQIGSSLNMIKANYDLILIDTCALSLSNKKNIDPVVIARNSDASVLVTSERSLNRESIQSIKAQLSQWKIRLAGSVHNSVGK